MSNGSVYPAHNESEEIISLGISVLKFLSKDSTGIGILNDYFMEPMLYSLPSSQLEYHDDSSLIPLPSAASHSIPQDASVMFSDSPPTTQVFNGFQKTGANPLEKDFYNLKLTDREHRVLYEAAKCIQKSYKGRKSRIKEQDKMSKAAVKKVPSRWRSLGCHVWRERRSGQFSGGASRSTARYCKKPHSPQQQHHMNNQDGSSKEPSPSKPLWTIKRLETALVPCKICQKRKLCFELVDAAKHSSENVIYRIDIPANRSAVPGGTGTCVTYNRIPKTFPATMHIARQYSLNKLTEQLREQIFQAGFTDGLTFTLSSRDDIAGKLNRDIEKIPAIHIANPISSRANHAHPRTAQNPGREPQNSPSH
ncbi:calmodulin-binding transcription activator [Culex quinquefasciatus]|uniref:Calmodulin-binding transcription activator n=1 Tax=Culex quinquefasciatus TaxID=7176 RepID=B0XFS6_CULQU|nr:calmodulin-binding transcription activator [Culex quinquefasciatus]|eukprot:XP_001868498.1 calmodulin-binding transcription activator [Culex quinquefasciatus]